MLPQSKGSRKRLFALPTSTLCFGHRRSSWQIRNIGVGMNDYSQEGAGKISLHGNGMGVPSPEDIERRAREIATIDERDPDEFTDGDWTQARKELLGAEHPTPPEETTGSAEMSGHWSVTASSRGHRAPRPGAEEDEESVGENLVNGGIEEATHDQMLEARREELEEERDRSEEN